MTAAEKIVKIIQDLTSLSAEHITPEANFYDDLGCDSLDHVELMLTLEQEFQIRIPDDDAEKLTTVQDVIRYVEVHK